MEDTAVIEGQVEPAVHEALDLSHLALAPDPDDYAQSADCRIHSEGHIFPCHSVVLSLRSKVLAGMFKSTDKSTWDKGLSLAMAGLSAETLSTFLHFLHFGGDAVSLKSCPAGITAEQLEAVARIAHKLDCPTIIAAIENFILSKDLVATDPVHWLAVSTAVGMPAVREECRKAVLVKTCAGDIDLTSDDWKSLLNADMVYLLGGTVAQLGTTEQKATAKRNLDAVKQYLESNEGVISNLLSSLYPNGCRRSGIQLRESELDALQLLRCGTLGYAKAILQGVIDMK